MRVVDTLAVDADEQVLVMFDHRQNLREVRRQKVSRDQLVTPEKDVVPNDVAPTALAELLVVSEEHATAVDGVHGQRVVRVHRETNVFRCPRLVSHALQATRDGGIDVMVKEEAHARPTRPSGCKLARGIDVPGLERRE